MTTTHQLMTTEDAELLRGILNRLRPINERATPTALGDKAMSTGSTNQHADTGFKFGKASQAQFNGVDERLVNCSGLALMKYSAVDFLCFEGLRTVERQRILVRTGKSRTMQSKHIVGLAVDLVPIIDGIPKWDWEGCAAIAFAMDKAATELGIADRITWGGAWDRRLSDYGGKFESYMAEVQAYKNRHAGSDFIDGPHFEIEPE